MIDFLSAAQTSLEQIMHLLFRSDEAPADPSCDSNLMQCNNMDCLGVTSYTPGKRTCIRGGKKLHTCIAFHPKTYL